jgi:glycosyltransferase involved in cell wall biosynthesis
MTDWAGKIQIPRVLVCQHGARRRYAVPRMLEEAGMLTALYTDSSEYSQLGMLAKFFGSLAPKKIKRLANRKITSIPANKIFSSDVLIYSDLFCRLKKDKHSEYQQWCQILSKKMETYTKKTNNFNIVYNMFCENLEFIRYIRNKYNVKIISDIYVNPFAGQIVAEEYAALKLTSPPKMGIQNIEIEHIAEACLLSDVLLCPSQFVADGVIKLNPKFSKKIIVCPYGSSIQYGDLVSNPQKGRVFWAGGDWVRKGLHVFAAAAENLLNKYPDMEFRVAGIENPNVINMHIFKQLKFLGKLNLDQMRNEFLLADCFALPSLAEGMAGVAIEASAAGCPVVATKSSGMDGIIDGTSGFIIQENDSIGLSAKIEQLYLDRELRQRVSSGAKVLAKDYTETAWSNRLLGIVSRLSGATNG